MNDIELDLKKLKDSSIEEKIKLIELEKQFLEHEKTTTEQIKSLEYAVNEKDSTIEQKNMKIEMLKVQINKINAELSEKKKILDDFELEKRKWSEEKKLLIEKIDKSKSENEEIIENYKKKFDDLQELIKNKEAEFENERNSLMAEITNEKNNHKEELIKLQEDFEKQKEKLIKEFEQKLKEEKENYQINDNIKILIGENQFISQINEILKNVKVRVLLILPHLDDLNNIDLSSIDENVSINLSTRIDLKNPEHENIISNLRKNYNIIVRNYESEDLWGLKKDGDSLLLASKLESGEYFGFFTSDIKNVNLFSVIISDANLRAKKIGF